MYDPALGRFTSADTIIPPGPQGLDRYAYVNNAPVMYVDPSGHFTQTAIYNYLYRQCLGGGDKNDDKVSARAEKCASSTIATWQADEDWWSMITDAEAGDVLFGTVKFSYASGASQAGSVAFAFSGSGNDILSGISYISGANGARDITLLEMQSGSTSRSGLTVDRPRVGVSIKWIGFYRPSSGVHPRDYYRYLRPGYSLQDLGAPYLSGAATTAKYTALGLTGLACGFGSIPAGFACGYLAGEFADAIIDALDVEETDYQLQVGPVYFNFQVSPDPQNLWTMENILYQP